MKLQKLLKATLLLLYIIFQVNNKLTIAQVFDHKYLRLDKAKYLVEYSQKAIPDSTDPELVRGGTMCLFVGDSISLYMSRSRYMIDTILRRITNRDEYREYLRNPNRPHTATLYMIYKNFQGEKITTIEPILTDTYKYVESFSAINWKIEDETSVINTYKVQKATCRFGGRNWVAWFCADIPINDGPYKFCGLPGLIVKLNDTRDYYTYTLQKIEIPEQSIFIDFQDRSYIESTKEGFFEARRLLLENSLTILKEAGAASNTMQTAARNIAKKNNPIELNVD